MVEHSGAPRCDFGDVSVSNEVFEAIASACARKVMGIAGLESVEGLVESLSKVWGRTESPRGVKVTAGDEDLTVDMTVILEEGYSIPQVTSAVQREVKTIIEEMTGHTVRAVNVLVADVQPPNTDRGIDSHAV